MEKKLSCLRCGQDMVFLRREHLQLGKTGLFTGDWGNLLAGALDVAILQCTGCKCSRLKKTISWPQRRQLSFFSM